MNPYTAVKSVLGLAALWIFISYFWRSFRLDAFRDSVFGLRDQMFIYAAERNIDFDNPAYVLLRNRMNVVLRYAHEFNLTQFLLVLLPHRPLRNSNLIEWDAAVKELPPTVRDKMREFDFLLTLKVFENMVFGSFLLYLVAQPLLLTRQLLSKLGVNTLHGSQIVEAKPEFILNLEQLESNALDQDQKRMAAVTVQA